MGNEKHDGERSVETEAPVTERPAVPLHDPFSRFEFEPTVSGDF